MLFMVTDITERKRMEAALRESEAIFSSFLEHSPVYVFFKDRDVRTLRLSRNYEQMLGVPIESALGKTMSELFPSEIASKMVADDLNILKNGQMIHVVEELNGRVYETTKFPVYKDNQPEMLAGFTIDVTDRKLAEKALLESEKRNRAIVAALPDLLFHIDVENIFLDCIANDPAKLLLPPEGVRGKHANEILPPHLAELTRDKVRLTLESNEMQIYDYNLEIGEQKYLFEARMTPLDEKSVLTLVRDITERKHIEDELRKSEAEVRSLNADLEKRVAERTAQLELANKELEAFAYSVSHDLRAPLRAIDGFSRILVEEHRQFLPAEAQALLDRVRAANQNMSQLVDALLGLSRMTRAELRRETFDISLLARKVIENLRQADPERKVEFSIISGVTANGDVRLMSIVLENLLGNAWKFTSKRGSARIEFGAEERDGDLVYFVRDNGAGFNMAYANKLFGAFQRLHSASEFEGTGIGLATVQRIIHRHGGRIWAESKPNVGTTFYFTLGANPEN